MSYPKLIIRAALAMVAGLGIATSSWGGSATANLAVSASVPQVCIIETSPVGFGPYDPIVAQATNALPASGAVILKCTKGSNPALTIGLGNGSNFSVSRRMTDGTNFLAYGLYQPPDGTPGSACATPPTVAWTNAGAGLLTTGVTAWGLTVGLALDGKLSFSVCGLVPAGQDAVVGASYTDTVVATVNF